MNDEIEILKYVENRLTEKQRIAFEERMKHDVDLQISVQSMQASFLPYAAAISDYESRNGVEEIPSSLWTFFDEISDVLEAQPQQNNNKKSPFFYYCQIAAFAGILFFAGFISNHILGSNVFKQKSSKLLTHYNIPNELFEYMVIYQALYNRRTVETVSQIASDTQKILEQFNSENDLSVKVPNLNGYGYQFKRVQQLSYQDKSILQFVYLGEDGEPIAICVTPGKSANKKVANESLVFADMNTVTWGDTGSVFMLISKESQLKLDHIAQELNAI